MATTVPRLLTRTFVLALIALSTLSMANREHELCHGFLPENDMKIPVGFKSMAVGAKGLDETQFNAILDRAQRLFGPKIAQAGGTLKINRLWTDETVNASATQNGREWALNMYGGFARHPATTFEGFALVVCHELGHHLGGAPKIDQMFGGAWATNEGGADYFAGTKCLRYFFEEDDNKAIIAAAKADGTLSPFAEKLCEQQFGSEADQLVCKRTSLSGTSVAGVFQAMKKEATPAKYDTPDNSRVTKTNDDHPATQCRMDTYLASAVCDVDKSVAVSNTDTSQGACVQGVAKVGYRPQCWFFFDQIIMRPF